MNPDSKLLQIVKVKEMRVNELQIDLSKAKDEYHQAIRDLHIAGMSLREIGEKLNLSHQRVHQIVEAGNPTWRFWLRPAKQALICSFCGADSEQVNKLVAGPNLYICDRCANGCASVIANGQPTDESTKFRVLPKTSVLRCSFCGKAPAKQKAVAASQKHQICCKCLDMTLRIMAEGKA